jgi:hypothetical protein
MVNKSLPEILMAKGETHWTDEATKDLIRRYTYRRSDLLSVGTKIIPVEYFNDLDITWEYPSDVEFDWPMPPEADAGRQVITWTKYGLSLDKGEFRWLLTDEAKIRGQWQRQRRTMIRKAGEAIAKKMDEHIVDTLIAGAGQSAAAIDEWDAGASENPIQDVTDAWSLILDQTNVTMEEMGNISVVVPTIVWGQLLRREEINNITVSRVDYLRSTYGLTFYPSRYLGSTQALDMALMVVNSEETAVFGQLRTNEIPLTETDRVTGRGQEWRIKKYFRCKVVPESSSVATNKRIFKITNVTTTV